MKKLCVAVVICAVAAFSIMGCGKPAGTEHPAGHEHPKSEHPK